jgi:hypothetical protein
MTAPVPAPAFWRVNVAGNPGRFHHSHRDCPRLLFAEKFFPVESVKRMPPHGKLCAECIEADAEAAAA